MKRFVILSVWSAAALMMVPAPAYAFCAMYAGKTDAPIYNHASKVVIARHDTRTVMTISADFQGDVNSFAMIIPVPADVTRGQINVTDNRLVDQLDAYTAPRALEYYDDDPCLTVYAERPPLTASIPMASMIDNGGGAVKSIGVSVNEQFAAGEYDITVLTAKQGKGLVDWLQKSGYQLSDDAADTLDDYIDDGMKFFIAKVNLLAFERKGYHYLRPIQVAYESDKVILPLRLGRGHAKDPQDMLLFTLTQGGRMEPSNYRMIPLPAGEDLPLYTAQKFDAFYDDMFDRQAQKEDMKTVFLEYAWDMAWCDPCTADPISQEDLVTLGAWWLEKRSDGPIPLVSTGEGAVPHIAAVPAPVNVFVTRMHLRYTPESINEDMVLQETDNRENFQASYNLRHPWTENTSCEQAKAYYDALPERFEKEAQNLASLTGWDGDVIRKTMQDKGQPFDIHPTEDARPWWEQMWENQQP